MNTMMIAIWYILWFMAGAAIFSFLNVVVYRVPRNLSFVKGHSFCPSCQHPLGSLDLVPIFSWIGLRGRCRYCKERISPRYMIVEIAGGALAVFCVNWYLPLTEGIFMWGQAGAVFAFLCILTVAALVDQDTMEIPNGFVIAAAVIGVLSYGAFPEISLAERGIGIFCISLPMLILALIIPGAFGGGDIKLMAACGIFLGWKLSLLSFFFAVLSGGSYGIYLLTVKKRNGKEHFAFGPFLCIGMAAAWFWGRQLLDWYFGFFF